MHNKLKKSDKLSVLESAHSFIIETENRIEQLKEQLKNRYIELKNSRSSEYRIDYYDSFRFCSIPSAIISVTGLIIDCNNQFCLYLYLLLLLFLNRIFNKPYNHVLNQSIFMIVPHQDLSLFYFYLSLLIGDNISGKFVSFEYNILCNNNIVKLHCTLQYIKNENENPFLVLNMIQMRVTYSIYSTNQTFQVQASVNEKVINTNTATILQASEIKADDKKFEQLLSGRQSF